MPTCGLGEDQQRVSLFSRTLPRLSIYALNGRFSIQVIRRELADRRDVCSGWSMRPTQLSNLVDRILS